MEDTIETIPKLSKAERLAARKKANKEWKRQLLQNQHQLSPVVAEKATSSTSSISNFDPNPRHTQYYHLQLGSSIKDDEWIQIHRAFATPLPVVFRLGGMCLLHVAHLY